MKEFGSYSRFVRKEALSIESRRLEGQGAHGFARGWQKEKERTLEGEQSGKKKADGETVESAKPSDESKHS
jgi:hypothetical protein